MLRTSSFACALALIAVPVKATQDDEPDGNKLVKVEFLADRSAIAPGERFTIAVKHTIEPQWHVYWENPGNTGIATKAEIVAPAGFEVGPLRFPPPVRHDYEGDIFGFVHESELVLLADVKAPASAKPGEKVVFSVESRWMVCTDVCVMGSGKAPLEMPIAETAKPAREKEFAAWRAKLPKPWSELKNARTMWSGGEAAPVLKLVVPGAQRIEFFPLRSPTMDMTKRTVEAGKQGASATVEWEFVRKEPGDKPVARGVLLVKSNEGESSYRFESAFEGN